MKITEKEDNIKSSLLYRFNSRESEAYSEVYIKFYDELFHFTSILYRGSEIDAADLLQDIFLAIWERTNIRFDTIFHIKGYIYQSIKNRYKDYISHKKHVDNYCDAVKLNDDYQISYMVESEVLSVLHSAIDTLPTECANIFRLYLEGWDTKEIAEKLGKSASTVYTQRERAIKSLKKKLPENLYFLFV